MLGMAYGRGRVVTKSPQEAVKWLRLAAESGYPKAEALLGLTLVTEAEVRNEEEGRRWVRKAAADGDPLGQSLLGEFLLSGKAGIARNEAEAAAWYRKAAEQGDAKCHLPFDESAHREHAAVDFLHLGVELLGRVVAHVPVSRCLPGVSRSDR